MPRGHANEWGAERGLTLPTGNTPAPPREDRRGAPAAAAGAATAILGPSRRERGREKNGGRERKLDKQREKAGGAERQRQKESRHGEEGAAAAAVVLRLQLVPIPENGGES